jgi:hypothetical protein
MNMKMCYARRFWEETAFKRGYKRGYKIGFERSITALINRMRSLGVTRKIIIEQLQEQYGLSCWKATSLVRKAIVQTIDDHLASGSPSQSVV